MKNKILFLCGLALFALTGVVNAVTPTAAAKSTQKGEVEHLNDQNFSQKISDGYVVVDFYATWCGPCKKFGPIFTKLANEMGDKIHFYKVNTDDSKTSSQVAQIQSIPTVILYHNGQEINRNLGAMTEDQFRNFLKQAN